MLSEPLPPQRGTHLRRNQSTSLIIGLNPPDLNNIFLINETRFLTNSIQSKDLTILPNTHYMIINHSDKELQLTYNGDISEHPIIYDPYWYENAHIPQIEPEHFKETHEIPEGYIDILAKWYSIKFTYPTYNLIFIKPQMGISFQIHQERSEYWEIIEGKPIVVSGNRVYYYVETGVHIKNPVGSYHSIINPNQEKDQYVVIKERWSGHFDEEDIERIFNPNDYH